MTKIRGKAKIILQAAALVILCIFLFYTAEKNDETFVMSQPWWDVRLSVDLNEYLDSIEDGREQKIMREAFLEAAKYVSEGETLMSDQIMNTGISGLDSDSGFPDSGIRLMYCNISDIWGSGIIIGIVRKEDGTYEIYNDCAKIYLLACLTSCDVDYVKNYYSLHVNGGGEKFDLNYEIEKLKRSAFVSYGDYENISDCFDAFGDVCQKMKEYQDMLGVDLSQPVRFGEYDRDTDLEYNYKYYPEHMVDFAAIAENPALLDELEQQVREEQLAYFKKMQPTRYEAIMNGSYISREEYRSPYYIPMCLTSIKYTDDDSWKELGYREGQYGEMSENGTRYQEYLRELEENGGKPMTSISEEWNEYQFSSTEKEWLTEYSEGVKYSYHWYGKYTDNFCIRYPVTYRYGSNEKCSNMIFWEYDPREKPFPGYSYDMEIYENRIWDMGRLYLFVINGEGPEKGDKNAFLDYLNSGKAEEKINSVLMEPVEWTAGELQTIYHDYMYAEGETNLRKTAVYVPAMREGEKFHWLLVFEEFKDTNQTMTLYKQRNEVIQNFILFPYWYECKTGDTLWDIANRLTGSGSKVEEVCESPLNENLDKDMIEVGQRIFIPPHVFLRDSVH